MATAYRQAFKSTKNGEKVERFLEKVEYRYLRRQLESSHVPFASDLIGNDEMCSRNQLQTAVDDIESELIDEGIEVENENVESRSLTPETSRSDLPEPSTAESVPKLELAGRLTPSPPPRKHLTFSNKNTSQVEAAIQTSEKSNAVIKTRGTQTPQKWIHDEERNEKVQERKPIIRHCGVRQQRKSIGRRNPPFAPYGYGDRNKTMAGKRTFNVKASKKVYESALRAARSGKFSVSKSMSSLNGNDDSDICWKAREALRQIQSWAYDLPQAGRSHSAPCKKGRFPITRYQRQFSAYKSAEKEKL